MKTAIEVGRGQPFKAAGVVPIQGIDRTLGQSILAGKTKVAPGLDTLQRLKAARAGCK
jgi:hypothetical protein